MGSRYKLLLTEKEGDADNINGDLVIVVVVVVMMRYINVERRLKGMEWNGMEITKHHFIYLSKP